MELEGPITEAAVTESALVRVEPDPVDDRVAGQLREEAPHAVAQPIAVLDHGLRAPAEGVAVDGDAEWGSRLILATITTSDGAFGIVKDVHVLF